MNNSTKTYIKRLVFILFALVWMIIVFRFSNEPADTSQNTSLNTTEILVETIAGNSINIEQKEQFTQELDPIVRKLAHFALYTLGGVLILNFINTYNIYLKKKIIYSIAVGAIYASTDEIHQLFVEGRGGLVTDVLLDSFGVATGVCIFLCIMKIIQMIRKSSIK